MQTTKSALMEAIRQRCPLLSERLTEQAFLELLRERNVYFGDEMIEKAEAGGLLVAAGREEDPFYTRGHMLVVYQLSRHSRIDWFPWDDARDDREDLLKRRIKAKREVWEEIVSDADSLKTFYDWFLGDDISAFPATEAVRLTELVRWSLQNIDTTGYLARLAEQHKRWQDAEGTVLLAAEMLRLRDEVNRILQNASDAGFAIPDATEVARDRKALVDAARSIDEENPLYATPPEEGVDANARRDFVTERDAMMKAEDWFGLVAHFERHADLFEGSSDAEAARQFALATLYGEHLEDENSAVNAYREMLEASPGSPTAITALEDVLSKAERWEDWVEILDEQSQKAEVEEIRDALALARARVLLLKLKRSAEALDAFSRAMNRPSSQADAAALLHDMVMEQVAGADFDVAGVEMLTEVNAFDDDPEMLAELFEQVEQRELSAKQRATLLTCQATHAERQGNQQRAFFRLSRALSHNPLNPRIHHELERLSHELGNADELAAILEDELEKATGIGSRAFIADRLGRLHAETGRSAEAIELLELAHEAQPTHKDLLLILAELYQEVGKIDRAIAMLEKLRGVTDDEAEMAEIAEVLAELRSQSLDDPKVALETYRGILQKSPDDEEALVGLLKIAEGDDIELAADAVRLVDGPLVRADRRNDVIDLYSKIIDSDAADKIDRIPLLERTCQLLEKETSRRGQALRRHAQLYSLRADPGTLAAARSLMLERSDTLIWVVTVQEGLESAPENIRNKLLKQLARTFKDQLGDRKESTRVYERLLERKPADKEAFKALERRYREKERWQDLVDMMLTRAEVAPDQKVELLMQVAEVFASELDDLQSAYLVYEQVLAQEPEHEDAKAAIEELLSRTDAPERRLEMLAEIEASSEGEKWRQARLRRVSLLAGNEKFDEAVELLEEAAEELEGDDEILERLDGLLRNAERWAEAAAVMRRRMDLAEDDATARRHKRNLAQLYADQLGMEEEASVLLSELQEEEATLAEAAEDKVRHREAQEERIEDAESRVEDAEEDSEQAAALDKLGRELASAGRSAEAIEKLSGELQELSDPDSQVLVLKRLAAMRESSGDLAGAEGDLKKVLALKGAAVGYVDELIAFYRRNRIVKKLYVLLNFRLNKTEEPRKKLSLLAEMANTAQQMRDYAGAITALQSFLETAEELGLQKDRTKVQRNLATLLARTGETAEAVNLLTGMLDSERPMAPPIRRELKADLAALHYSTGAVEAASELADEVLADNPEHGRMSLLKLDMLVAADKVDEGLELAETLSSEESSFPRQFRTGLLSRLARMYASKGETSLAAETYQTILSLDPNNEEAKTFLENQES